MNYSTPHGSELCDKQLPEGWYRFVGAAGTKMPTTRVPAYRCGTDWSGWLDGSHPTVEDGKVQRKACFSDRSTGCKNIKQFLLKTVDPTSSTNFNSQVLVTLGTVVQTECEAKILRNKRTHKFIRRSTLFRDFAKSSFYDNH